jgi:hypothetical protein
MTTKTYDRHSGTFLAAIAQNLPDISGNEMQKWIGDPAALQKVLRNAFPPDEMTKATPYREFPVWKTIKLSDGSEVELANVSVAELGFEKPPTYFRICDRATKHCNLALITEHESRQLAKQYPDQPKGERLSMGMDSFTDREGELVVRQMWCDDRPGKQIAFSCVEGDIKLEMRYVFVRRKQSSLQAEEISSRVAVGTLRNSTTVMAHVVKVGSEYFEVLAPATGPFNDLESTDVKKIDIRQITLCSAIAQAIEQARAKQ